MTVTANSTMKRFAGVCAAASVSAIALAGCSPTYGTDKTANAQLVSDLSGIMSLGPNRDRAVIQYHPRPELVKPSTTAVLPPPQQDPTAQASAQWPESPEQRLRRVRQEASDGTNATPIIRDGSGREQISENSTFDPNVPGASRAEFQRRLAQNNQGSANVRRTLSEPPLTYRQPAATAPTDDLGEPEWKKEREAKRKAGKRRGLRDMLPW